MFWGSDDYRCSYLCNVNYMPTCFFDLHMIRNARVAFSSGLQVENVNFQSP